MDRLSTKQYELERAQVSLRASLIGLLCNVLLAASKIAAGIISGAVSILADGINNLSDSATVIVSMLSMSMARKPGDAEHPFGHGRLEYVGSLVISSIILYIGVDLLLSSVQAVLHPSAPMFSWVIVGLTAVTLPVKWAMLRMYRKNGEKYKIQTLKAAAQDSFNDILITSAVVVGLLVLYFFGIVIDGYLGVLVSGIILFSGICLIRETVNDLIGGKPDRELGEKILTILKKYPELLGEHDFVLHDYGPGRKMASIHAEVSAGVNLLDIHDVVDQAEQEILRELGLPISIHIDPVMPDDDPAQGPKTRIEEFLARQDPPLSLHDFRMIPGKRQIRLIFDVVVPETFGDEEELIQRISEFARQINPRFECIIQVDRNYFTHVPQ